ncbi:MAG TPA: response regulator transcription factor [Armatimonadota bacterium]|jgi:two-component system alkaline phosphatase synthesis response regulator PhoP
MRKILIIDDDENLSWAVQKRFENLGFEVATAAEGRKGVELVEKERPDLVILDLNLPDVDGLDICRYLRRRTNIPVVMLTGRAEDNDTIVGLEIGADDYVTKPFNLNELAARVRAVLRRANPEMMIDAPAGAATAAGPSRSAVAAPPPRVMAAAGVEMDAEAKRVWVEGREVQLTPTEFKLLQTLLENQGKVVSTQDLLRAAWGYEGTDTHLVEVHIGNLRSKVETNSRRPERVKTVRGFGYRIDSDGS